MDGAIEERNLGQNDHSAWQKAIVVWFELQAKSLGVRIRPELRIQVAGERIRIPDVGLLNRTLEQEPIPTHPPIAVFEVVSPDDTLPELAVRCLDYERMGRRTILVLDPEGPQWRFVNGDYAPIETRSFDIPGSRCRFDLDRIEPIAGLVADGLAGPQQAEFSAPIAHRTDVVRFNAHLGDSTAPGKDGSDPGLRPFQLRIDLGDQ